MRKLLLLAILAGCGGSSPALVSDAGVHDAGPVDAGHPDAGPPDSGPPPSISLTGTADSSTAAVDLTAEGALEWRFYGSPGDSFFLPAAPAIDVEIIGGGPILTYDNDPRAVSWSNGGQLATSTSHGGAFRIGKGVGFALSLPADGAQHVLALHVGGYSSAGQLTAFLGDATYSDTTEIAAGQYDRNYAISYRGASGETLAVSWVMSDGTGNVTLQAAAIR